MEVTEDPDSGHISVEGYSEVWLSRAMENLGLTLSPHSTELDLANVGVLIAAIGLHEMMHMKVEPFMQLSNPRWSLHANGGGGIARTGKHVFQRIDRKLTATVTSRNVELIRANIDRPVKQVQRTK